MSALFLLQFRSHILFLCALKLLFFIKKQTNNTHIFLSATYLYINTLVSCGHSLGNSSKLRECHCGDLFEAKRVAFLEIWFVPQVAFSSQLCTYMCTYIMIIVRFSVAPDLELHNKTKGDNVLINLAFIYTKKRGDDVASTLNCHITFIRCSHLHFACEEDVECNKDIFHAFLQKSGKN